MYKFGTKAETLEFLSGKQDELKIKVLPLCYFSIKEFRRDNITIWNKVESFFQADKLIIRSSARGEDTIETSNAGKYTSCIINKIYDEFVAGVGEVINSYGICSDEDQFFIQPLLENVSVFGVAFTREPNNGAHYYVINYDTSGSTDAITAGTSDSDVLYYCFKDCIENIKDDTMYKIGIALKQLEQLFETDKLDVEFAFKDDNLYIFQVRPLCIKNKEIDKVQQSMHICQIQNYIKHQSIEKAFLYGKKAVYSNMADWNPAEMIGTYPRPLALSLYKELITDNIWAYQRDNYGYMNLRSFPLLINFEGMPYIDVRVSFNSFIPADLEPKIASKLVDFYIDQLEKNTAEHDKIEFNIIYSCYTFDLSERIKKLHQHGFTNDEIQKIIFSLKNLTNCIIDNDHGLWKKDIAKIEILKKRYANIVESNNLDEVEKIYWLIEDCKRYGTLPFAGLARAGFIAVQLLKSMVEINILSLDEYEKFMSDVISVSSLMKRDFSCMSKEGFLREYGHLRPGTYDITSLRYDEAPNLYFDWNKKYPYDKEETFSLSLSKLEKIRALLRTNGMHDDVFALFSFIKSAIEGREFAKFIFTKSLSKAMQVFIKFAEQHGVNREDASYADIEIIKKMYSSTIDRKEILLNSIAAGKVMHESYKGLVLPSFISKETDVTNFFIADSEPTYISQGKVCGKSMYLSLLKTGDTINKKSMEDKIILINAADPGYDWIFSYDIAGLITEYGGANSHMAIRAGELSIPAIIGVGKKKFNVLKEADIIEFDTVLKKVTIIR